MSYWFFVLSLFASGFGWAFVQSRRGSGKPLGPDIAVFCVAVAAFIAFVVSFVWELS